MRIGTITRPGVPWRLGVTLVAVGGVLGSAAACSRLAPASAVVHRSPAASADLSSPPAGSPNPTPSAATPSPPGSTESDGAPVRPVSLPATIVEIGDSLGIDLGYGLRDVLAETRGITLIPAAYGSSGLIRPEFYDWQAHLQELLHRYQPDLVIVFLGANDVQNFFADGRYEKFGTPEWRTVYAARVGALMDEAVAGGAQVLWVGMPAMRDPAFDSAMSELDGIFRQEAAGRAGVRYFASRPVLAGPDGRYATSVTTSSGRRVVARAPDGVHITFGTPESGATILAQAVVGALHAAFGLR